MSRYLRKVGEIVTMEEIAEQTGKEDIEDLTVVQRPDPADFVGDFPVYETYKRSGELLPFRYAGRCLGDLTINFDPKEAIREYVCSPFSADTREDQCFYLDLAIIICKSVFQDGGMPIAPHLYFPNFLDDNDKKERAWGLAAGLGLLKTCDKMTVVVIDGYISEGMKQEIWHAIYDLEISPHYIRLTRAEAEELIRRTLYKE